MDKADIIALAAANVCSGELENARQLINSEYPFEIIKPQKRNYTDSEKMRQFVKDGFIDRYSGDKLVNPGMLRTLSVLFPEDFPFQKNWKMDKCHIAYWELVPTVDHVVPVAAGGLDDESNWVTTSMMHNMIKSNWTLEQIGWTLVKPGDIAVWDGLTARFVEIVEKNEILLHDGYIKKWYNLSKNVTRGRGVGDK